MSTQRAAADRGSRRSTAAPGLPSITARVPAAAVWWLLAALPLLGAAPSAAAQPAAATPVPASDEQLIATVMVNAVARGEFTLLRKPEGDFWIEAADLPRLDVAAVEAARRTQGGESFFSLRGLGAVALKFDESSLSLEMTFPAQTLSGTRIDLSNRPPPAPPPGHGNSLILSYRLAMRPAFEGQAGAAALDTDLNVRVGPVLLRQEARIDTSVPDHHFARGASQAVWDDPVAGTRLIVGDVLSSAGNFGTSITGAGVLYARVFDITPDLIRQPTAALRAQATLPATVEVAVDGNTIYRGQVAPGPIALDNLLQYGGTRNVRVTVTDASGRRDVYDQPFLFTDSVLARGLHEFSYFGGKRSALTSSNARQYLEPAWQAYHRYGATDWLTVSAGGEGSTDFTTAGAGAALRDDRLGLIAAEALTSASRDDTRRANGWSARYTYQLPRLSFLLGRRQYEEGFRTFGTSAFSPFLRSETRASLAASLLGGTAALDFVRSIDAFGPRTTRAVRWATSLSRGLTLAADLQASRDPGRTDRQVNVFLRADLEHQRWFGTTARSSNGARAVDLEAGQQIGQAEGLGYRVGASSSNADAGTSATSFGSVQWNLKPASLEFYGAAPLRGGSGSYAQFGVSGAVVAVDGFMGLTRRVDGSFVLARLGVPQPGVEVLLNNQAQGRTDADGTLFVPSVGPYARQDLSIDDKDVGMQYNLAAKRQTIALPYRGGSVVDFGGRKLRALAGVAWRVDGTRRTPIASSAFVLTGSAGRLAVDTSRNGDFYLEDAPPGSYAGVLALGGKTYACRIDVPAFPEPVHETKEGIVCD